jgi:hypothetical protein
MHPGPFCEVYTDPHFQTWSAWQVDMCNTNEKNITESFMNADRLRQVVLWQT